MYFDFGRHINNSEQKADYGGLIALISPIKVVSISMPSVL